MGVTEKQFPDRAEGESGENQDLVEISFGDKTFFVHATLGTSAADVLTADGVLSGGRGSDSLTAGWVLTILVGGDGNDTSAAVTATTSSTARRQRRALGRGGQRCTRWRRGDDWFAGDRTATTASPARRQRRIVRRRVTTPSWAGDGNDIVYGEDGSDNLDGGNGGDTLFGQAGNDALYGRYGLDTLDGGDGAICSMPARTTTCSMPGRRRHLIGWTGDDILRGGNRRRPGSTAATASTSPAMPRR